MSVCRSLVSWAGCVFTAFERPGMLRSSVDRLIGRSGRSGCRLSGPSVCRWADPSVGGSVDGGIDGPSVGQSVVESIGPIGRSVARQIADASDCIQGCRR